VIFAVAALGALTAAVGFPRRTRQDTGPGPAPSSIPIATETDARAG
jgi:hypothetical protein